MRSAEALERRVLARRKCRALNGVQDVAMAGVAVMLLIVGMIAVAMQQHHSGFPADMAKAKHVVSMPGAKREDAIRIVVTRDGAIYFSHTEIGVGELAKLIRQKVRSGSERRAYLMVDQRAKYGDVDAVVDAIRASGIWNVGLLVEQNR